MKRVVPKFFQFFLVVAFCSLFQGEVFSQSSPDVDYLTLTYALERNPELLVVAKNAARERGLPIMIHIPGEVLIEAAGVEEKEVVYTVISNFLDPRDGGYTAFFDHIEAIYDLENAEINYGRGIEGPENRWVPDNSVLPPNGVILIPESSNDRVMAFNRFDGSLVNADFIPADPNNLSTPIEATPDLTGVGFAYLSDQLDDVVNQYDGNTGNFIQVFAPAGGSNTSILDNIRGIEFSPDGTLLVSVGGGANADGIAEFDATGTYIGNLIANGAGGLASPFDVLYWEAQNIYVIPGINSNAMHLYDIDGNPVTSFPNEVDFPEQANEMADGNFVVADFTTDELYIYDINGLVNTITPTGFTGLRGVYLLGNGNFLITNGGGVHEVDPSGNLVETEMSGVSGRFIQEYGTPLSGGPGECGFICPDDITETLTPGACDKVVFYNVIDTGNCAPYTLEFVEGLASGSTFPIGTTTNTYQFVDDEGTIVAECSFDVNIFPYTGNIAEDLTCNDLVHISVDSNCLVQVYADDFLEGGPYGCYLDYEVYIDQYGPNNDVNGQGIELNPGFHSVTVLDPSTGNSCWGEFLVEDKLPPTIECIDASVLCTDSTDPVFTDPVEGVAQQSSSPGTSIGPGAGIVTTETLNVITPGNAIVTDINITIGLTHTWSADLDVFLIGPEGGQVELASDVCGSSDDWDNVTFDDEAGIDVAAACMTGPPALTGFVRPEGLLADFDNQLASGDWTLMITDDAGGDGGTLNFVSIEVSYFVTAPYAPTGSDNCDDDLDLTYSDVESGDDCEAIIITRTWVVTDDSGLTASCVQTITVTPIGTDGLECPENFAGSCGDSADPENTGYPTLDGADIVEGGICNIFAGYSDKEIEDCGGGTKIIRTWTILDWCTQELFECTQIIKLADDVGPEIVCPDDITVIADPWYCSADFTVPQPVVSDACGTPYSIELDAGQLSGFLLGTAPFYSLNDAPIGTWTLTWIATDACGNSSTCTFDVSIEDGVPPTPACDEHTVVSLVEDHLYDEGLTKIPAIAFDDGSEDNCGPVTILGRRMDSCIDFDWTTEGAGIDETPNGIVNSRDRGTVFRPLVPFACCDVGAGSVMVELQITDTYGNTNFCMVEVEVQDKIAPFLLCPPDIEVSCSYWFPIEETAGFIPQENDPLTPIFGQILDEYEYELSDRDSIIIDDPANPNMAQPHFWGLDGWADDNCDVDIDVRVRIIDECKGETLPPGAPQFARQVVERTFRATDPGGNATTCRQFIWIVDFIPFYISDQTCNNPDPNDGVIWPCDRNFTTCPDEIPEDTPTVFDDKCSIIGISFEDQVFYFVPDACRKILRTWAIIDWCQYDQTTGEGYWEYVQVIKVTDNEAPEFLDCPGEPVTLCVEDEGITIPSTNQSIVGENDPNASRCTVHARIEHEVRETCSTEVIFDVKVYLNDGDDFIQVNSKTPAPVDTHNIAIIALDTKLSGILSIRQNGLPYNDRWCSNFPFPGGTKDYHRVLFTVEDGCGNISTCEYLLRLEDCKQPTPVCINGLSSVVMPSTGEVTIWASDFDASSFDDCTLNEDLKFGFSGTNDHPSAKFACDCSLTSPDYPGQPCYDPISNGTSNYLVEIWVADEGTDDNCDALISWGERNKDFCTTFIIINDTEQVCDTSASEPVSGAILTEENDPVEKVDVNLKSPSGDIMTSFTTGESGNYYFLHPTIDWMVAPEKDDNPKNGVSTLDLVRIQKHLLGIEKFDSPYKLIAADANNSESVSAVDLVELRKLILGIYNELPNNNSWRFVDGKYNFTDPNNPWPFNEESQYNGAQHEGLDFMGIKVGDVNGTAVANATQIEIRNAKEVLRFVAGEQLFAAGDEVLVALATENVENILGFQFTLDINGLQFLGLKPGELPMSAENLAVFGDAITTSWHHAESIIAEPGSALFTLKFKALQNGRLSEMLNINSLYTEAEAYNGDEQILDVKLAFRNKAGNVKEYALYQNEPNPFSGESVIGFSLPEATSATLTIYDITGKVLKVFEGDYPGGMNQVTVKSSAFTSGGILYYSLRADKFTATKKMIVVR